MADLAKEEPPAGMAEPIANPKTEQPAAEPRDPAATSTDTTASTTATIDAAEKKAVPHSSTPADAEQKDVTAQQTTSTNGSPQWPSIAADHPLAKFHSELEPVLKEADYNEIYGITLSPSETHFHTKIILQKFLRANANDLEKAKTQLLNTLKWRKSYQPQKVMHETFSRKKFGGLGYVCEVPGVKGSPNEKDVVTFNIYGAVKDPKVTFGDLDSFLRWRISLMELSVQKLNLPSATTPIPDYLAGADPHTGIQVHDYLSVSFLRQDPNTKAATKKTIETLSAYYPETLSRKFFVNVPLVMGWMFTAMRVFIPAETQKKFTVLSYGNTLVNELGPGVPEAYGGKAGKLAEVGEELKMEE